MILNSTTSVFLTRTEKSTYKVDDAETRYDPNRLLGESNDESDSVIPIDQNFFIRPPLPDFSNLASTDLPNSSTLAKEKSVSTVSGTISHELGLQDESVVTDETDACEDDGSNRDNETDARLVKHKSVADTNPVKENQTSSKGKNATSEILASEPAIALESEKVPQLPAAALPAVPDDAPKKKKRKWPTHQRVRSLVINPIRPAYQVHQASWNHSNISQANESISKFTYTSSYRHK